MFFANEQRESVREENPGISFGRSLVPLLQAKLSLTAHAGQVGKVLGERWKALTDEQRRPYEEKALADKKRYEDEKASYNVRFSPSPVDGAPCSASMMLIILRPQAGDEDEESS